MTKRAAKLIQKINPINGTVENQAANRRRDAAYRAWLCAQLGAPIDSCYTTSELERDARKENKIGWWSR